VAPRAYWKGYLKLSLVSCPVALFPASWILRDFFDEKRFKKATDLGCPLRRDHILIEHIIDRFQRRRHVLSTHCLL
jgi:hypothetical protein